VAGAATFDCDFSSPYAYLGRALAATLGLALAAAPPALAGKVEATEHIDAKEFSQDFSYSALPGEANRLALAVRGRRVVVTDAAGVRPGRGCKRPDPARPTRAVCTFEHRIGSASTGFFSTVRLRGGDDRLRRLPRALAGTVSGGPGGDSIGGSPGDDTIRGGPGSDRIRGGAGNDELAEGDGGDAGDELDGGRGTDTVGYSRRREGVSADLEGDADDGRPGEGDRIGADVENLDGGSGPDLLRGSRRSRLLRGFGGDDMLLGGAAAALLLGGGGNDRLAGGRSSDVLNGGPGNDVVDAGPGQDRLEGGGGDDSILARDGSAEFPQCDEGNDRAEVDQLDMVLGGDCEALERDGPAAGGSFFVGHELFRMTLSRRALLTPVGCPQDFGGPRCSGFVTITSSGRAAGRRRYSLPRGKWDDELPVKVSRRLRLRIRRRGAVAVGVTVTTAMPDGSRVARSTRLVAYRR
jgi:hypothetical protein